MVGSPKAFSCQQLMQLLATWPEMVAGNGKLEAGVAPSRRWAVVVIQDRGRGGGIAVLARSLAAGATWEVPLRGTC